MASWDEKKLNELRAKYGESHGGELFDPTFRKVADKIFSKSGTRLAPYAGIPTFLTAPYMPVDANNPDFGNLQVAIVGVPMDLGVTNRTGSRFGPRALRTIERIGPYNHVLDCAPVFDLRVADIGDVPFASRYRLEQSHDDIEAPHQPDRRCRRGPAFGRRRPFDHPSDPESCRQEAPGRHDPYRRALRYGRRLRPDEIPSWRPVPQCGSRRRARSEPHDPDRHSRFGGISLGVLLRIRHDRHPCRRSDRSRHSGDHREGADRSSATVRPTFPSTSTASIQALRRAPARRKSAA